MSHVFLSYAAEDRTRAQRVAHALEALGSRVWWDRDIVGGDTFDETIARALREASVVVVLWSSYSVSSEWVREEASNAKGRNILVPVFLDRVDLPLGFTLRQAVDLSEWDGSPHATEFGALAGAISKITASVLQSAESKPVPVPVPVPDVESGRARQLLASSSKTKPRPRWATLGVVALGLALAGGGLWFWDAYYREQTEHFANVTRRWGFPEGSGRLSDAQVARRAVSLAFVRHGRRNPVDEVRLVNATGNTPPPSTYVPPFSVSDLNPLPSAKADDDLFGSDILTTARLTFARDSSGRILEENAFTRGGRHIYTLHFADVDVGEYKRHGFGTPVRESGIGYLRFSRVASGPNAGIDQKVMYLDGQQRPQPDERGEYGYRLVLDDRGQITERVGVGVDGKDHPNTDGVLKEVRVHDGFGNVVEMSTFGADGKKMASRTRVASTRAQYDDNGNLTRFTMQDAEGRLIVVSDIGAAGRAFTYDDHGRLTSGTFFGPDQQPIAGRLGFAKQTIEWLAPNRALARFYGANGHPAPAFGSAFEAIETWDERGLSIETTYRDEKSVPTRVENGCSTLRVKYDDMGNTGEIRCLNERGEPTLTTYGYSFVRVSYDELGNPVTTDYFDVLGKPGRQGESFTSLRQEYNAFGKLAKKTYLNAQGQPQMSREGYASVVYTYDSQGNQIRVEYFDQKDMPASTVYGYVALMSRFDDRGFHLENVTLAADGRAVNSDEGYAGEQCGSSDRLDLEDCTFLNEHGAVAKNADGFASYRIKGNAEGQRIETTYFDARRVPTLTRRPGSASRRWTYDSAGRVVERSDYDTAGRLMRNAYGYATIKYTYDEYGRETGRAVFDPSGRSLAFKVGVDKLLKGSIAADAGLRVGDLLLTYDGQAVESTDQFYSKLELFRGDRARVLTVSRDGRVLGLDIPPGRLDGLALEEIVP